MDEQSAVIAWAYALLVGLAGGQVYDSQAPQGTLGDYLILQAQAYTENGTAADGTLGSASMMLTVKAITRSSGFATAAALLKSAHALLAGQRGASNGITVDKCVREAGLRYPENRDGVRYNHLGAIYRVTVTYQ